MRRSLKKSPLVLILVLSFFATWGQNKAYEELAPIIEKGRLMYRQEKAAWLASDLMGAYYPDISKIGGYITYSLGDSTSCVFYSQGEKPRVLASVDFDSSLRLTHSNYINLEREFSDYEKQLYRLRQKTINLLQSDTLIRVFQGSSLNLLPLIHKGQYQVYILSAPLEEGMMILGNDYLFEFNENLELQFRRRLHHKPHFLKFKHITDEGDTLKVVNTSHSHNEETGAHLTPTDICTLLLYGPLSDWETHEVISREYYTVWDIQAGKLSLILTRESWNKIREHQKQKKNDKTKTDD